MSEETRALDFQQALTKAVKDARARAIESGAEQEIEGIRIYGMPIYLKPDDLPEFYKRLHQSGLNRDG